MGRNTDQIRFEQPSLEQPTALSPERHRRLWGYFEMLRRQGHEEIADTVRQILYAPIRRWEDR